MLTSSELKQILDYLAIHGKKDSQLTPLPTYEHASIDDYIDYLAVIKDGDNRKVSYANLRDALIDAFSSQSSMIDDVPTEDSRNLVRSGGVFDAIKEKSIPDGSVDWDKLAQDVIDAIETHASTGVAFTSDLTQEIPGDIAVRQAPLYQMRADVNQAKTTNDAQQADIDNLKSDVQSLRDLKIIIDGSENPLSPSAEKIYEDSPYVVTGNAIYDYGETKVDKINGTSGHIVAFGTNNTIADTGKSVNDVKNDLIGDPDNTSTTDDTINAAKLIADSKIGKFAQNTPTDKLVLTVGGTDYSSGIKYSTLTEQDITNTMEQLDDLEDLVYEIHYKPAFNVKLGSGSYMSPIYVFKDVDSALTARATLEFNGESVTDFTASTPEDWTAETTTGSTRTFTRTVNLSADSSVSTTIAKGNYSKEMTVGIKVVSPIYYGKMTTVSKTLTGLNYYDNPTVSIKRGYPVLTGNDDYYFVIAVPNGVAQPTAVSLRPDYQYGASLNSAGTETIDGIVYNFYYTAKQTANPSSNVTFYIS